MIAFSMTAMNYSQTVWQNLAKVRANKPLVHNITNFVVMNMTANAILALGASPIMAHAQEELGDLLDIASSLVLNIGTLDAHWISSMQKAAALARKRGIPVVLDPVGAGASRLRTETALGLIQIEHPTVIRGNASEILAVAGTAGKTKGVDSILRPEAAEDAARQLAQSLGCVVVASGAVDFITDGSAAIWISGGTPLAPYVTGMGCTSSALIAAFASVEASPLLAALAGMGVMKVAAELAAEKAAGPGTFQSHFLDALHNFSALEIASNLKITGE